MVISLGIRNKVDALPLQRRLYWASFLCSFLFFLSFLFGCAFMVIRFISAALKPGSKLYHLHIASGKLSIIFFRTSETIFFMYYLMFSPNRKVENLSVCLSIV